MNVGTSDTNNNDKHIFVNKMTGVEMRGSGEGENGGHGMVGAGMKVGGEPQ